MALASYLKTAWVNLTSPPINADNLNHIEEGIFATREQTITNIGGISANGVAIANNASAISDLSSFGTYDYVKKGIPDTGNPIVITDTTYQDIAELTTPIRGIGTYQITFSLTFDYDSTNKSAGFQWTLDNGTTWEQFSIEPKDKSDKKALTYTFPSELTVEAIFNFKMQGKCESSGNTLTVDYANIIIERKK